MRKNLGSGLGILVVVVLTVFLAVGASGTSFDDPSPESDTVVNPGETVNAFSFDVLYGGDSNITGGADPGTELREFVDDETMFLNQSRGTGVNGYADGDDIINVSLAYSDGTPSDFNATKIGLFGSDVYFLDGSVDNNSRYDGEELVASGEGEAVIRSSSGVIDNDSEVVVPGRINARGLSPEIKYIESGVNTRLDGGFYGDEVLINSSDNFLNQSDSVYDLGGEFELDEFTPDTTRYLEANSSQTDFVASSAIVRETASNDNVLEEADYGVVKDGKADIVWLDDTNMLHGGTPSTFQEGDPIYYSKDDPSGTVNGYVNVSDVRLGDYMVYSRSGNGVTLGQDLFHVMDDSDPNPEVNDIGKTLNMYNGGEFVHLEYNTSGTTNAWDPESTADQDVLIYNKNSSTVGEGDVVVYDQRPENDNVSVDPGYELDSASDFAAPDTSRVVDVEIGYNDSDEDSSYTAGDQIVLNVSDSTGNHVVLSPEDQFGNITSDSYNDSLGNITRWKTTLSSGIYSDGIYIAMNDTSQVSDGDLRMGHWNKSVSSGDLTASGNGTVEASDIDVGAQLLQFQSSFNVAMLDRDHDGQYDPGIGRISDNDKGREAIIRTNDEFLNSSDTIVREGKMPSTLFSPETRYFDTDGSGFYDTGEAIASYSSGFDNSSEVVLSGLANISNLNAQVKYLETGPRGFDPDKDPLFFDSTEDKKVNLGVLDRSVSADYVFTGREGNLHNFDRSLNSSGDNASVFLDSNNEDGSYDVGEEIMEVELLKNSSASDTVDEMDLVNFADSTRHSGEAYTGVETIINDTDMNGVYQNVVESVSVLNIISDRTEDFFTEATRDDIEEVNLYRYNGTEYNIVTELTDGSGKLWERDISENITQDTEFLIEFEASPKGDLDDKAYGFEGDAVIGMKGGSDGNIDSGRSYIVDAHAPELDEAWTGDRDGGDSSSYNQVFVKTNEKYSNLDYSSVGARDFRIKDNSLLVENAEETGTNDILLTLNDSLESNRTLDVNLSEVGSIRDVASNSRVKDDVNVQDGLNPLLTSQTYHDLDENSTVDAVKLEFSEEISYNSFADSDWNVTERQLTGLQIQDGTVNNNDTFILEASADDNITGVADFEPFLDYDNSKIVDISGNSLNSFNRTLADRAAPRMKNASVSDLNSDARIDNMKLQFTEPISDVDSILNSSSFNVKDADINEVNSASGAENLSLELESDLLTSETPNITLFNNSIFDLNSNAISSDQEYSGIKDKASPVLLHAQINPRQSGYGTSFVDLQFSEPVVGLSEDITLEGKNFSFESSGSSVQRTLNYSDLLATGNMPNITDIYDVRDQSGNNADLSNSENITVNSFRKELEEGWNFVSFPIADESTPEINETLNTSKVETIWTYTDKEWQIYDPEASENDFEEFEGGLGYMIKANESFTLAPNVDNVRDSYTGGDLIKASVELQSGFNLVGPFQEFNVPADSPGAFGAIDESQVGAVYEQNKTGERELDVIRSSNGSSPGEMMSGEAYWMKWQAGNAVTYSEPEP